MGRASQLSLQTPIHQKWECTASQADSNGHTIWFLSFSDDYLEPREAHADLAIYERTIEICDVLRKRKLELMFGRKKGLTKKKVSRTRIAVYGLEVLMQASSEL